MIGELGTRELVISFVLTIILALFITLWELWRNKDAK